MRIRRVWQAATNGLRGRYPVVFITVVVIITVLLITLADGFLGSRPQVMQDEETIKKLEVLFPETASYTIENGLYTVYDESRHKIGYAFYAEGQGWGGKIVILVGLVDKETIKGINIISHSERYGWGEGSSVQLDFSSFVPQFAGLKLNDCSLKKSAGKVDGITGATTSSKAVVEAVREKALEESQFIR